MTGYELPRERKMLEWKRTLRAVRADWLLYAMLIPGLLYFFLFHYMPMYGVTIAFRDYNIVSGMDKSNCLPMAFKLRLIL